LRLAIRGAVQGVGFRPFVFRLATGLRLNGWVNNSAQGVFVEIEGEPAALEQFLVRIEKERPPRSSIQSIESTWLDPVGYSEFEIRASERGGLKTALVLPDIATCADCQREIFNPGDRRYSYPFTNCTNCGPRFSIVEALPYDRANTSMKSFAMCPQCRAEYDDPLNRRFHAQPNACPVCGPRLELWGASGEVLDSSSPVLEQAADAIRNGRIVAVKGLGGFHLITPAHDSAAVLLLRERKHREEKPFALMFPSLDSIRAVCEVSPLEERLLLSAEAPIVLLRRHTTARGQCAISVCHEVAPGNPYLGAMLPYTPLHHLLLSLLQFPVVATSGNLSDEPICTDEREALQRLAGVADLFLVHNRPIVRHVDDSIARVVGGREQVLRRARGSAPLPIRLENAVSGVGNVLAVGAHLKSTVALSVGPQVFISQHIGDLETGAAYDAFRRVIADFEKLYETRPDIIAADSHPDYLSTQFATSVARASAPVSSAGVHARSSSADAAVELVQRNGLLVSVQHHLAHTLSCMAENELDPPVLGVSWDGTGYGADATIWGGEFFDCRRRAREAGLSFHRVAHLRQYRLPGGEQAIKEPRRSAIGLLYASYGDAVFGRNDLPPIRAFSSRELASLKTMLQRGLNSPVTSSIGRLFDAVASLAGLRQQTRFEGQAAMELEFNLANPETEPAYQFDFARPEATSSAHGSALILDWAPLVESVLGDLQAGASAAQISARFHNGLVEAIVMLARKVGHPQVCLSGGCFQNRYLTERAIGRLRAEGFRPYWQQRVPPNDGGIALGQIVAARYMASRSSIFR
jgi:hydrogenase maturation protein HypF